MVFLAAQNGWLTLGFVLKQPPRGSPKRLRSSKWGFGHGTGNGPVKRNLQYSDPLPDSEKKPSAGARKKTMLFADSCWKAAGSSGTTCKAPSYTTQPSQLIPGLTTRQSNQDITAPLREPRPIQILPNDHTQRSSSFANWIITPHNATTGESRIHKSDICVSRTCTCPSTCAMVTTPYMAHGHCSLHGNHCTAC